MGSWGFHHTVRYEEDAATVDDLLAELGRSTRSVLGLTDGVRDAPRDRAASPLRPHHLHFVGVLGDA